MQRLYILRFTILLFLITTLIGAVAEKHSATLPAVCTSGCTIPEVKPAVEVEETLPRPDGLSIANRIFL